MPSKSYESWLSVPLGQCTECEHMTPSDRESGECPLCGGEVAGS